MAGSATLPASLIVAVLLACTCAAANDQNAAAVEQVERARFAAMVTRNVEALDTMLAADLYYCHSNGRVESKPQFLETIRTQRLRYDTIEVRELNIRHKSGNVAIVTGLANVRANIEGKDLQIDLRYADTYVLRDGRWQLLTWQSTRVQ